MCDLDELGGRCWKESDFVEVCDGEPEPCVSVTRNFSDELECGGTFPLTGLDEEGGAGLEVLACRE